MVDIIHEFGGYAREQNIPRRIANDHYYEIMIARKYQELDENIGKLRAESMKYTFVDPGTGSIKTSDDPRLAEILQEIRADEAALQEIKVLANEIGAILAGHGVGSVKDLNVLKGKHVNIISSGPWEAWDHLVQTRGLGKSRPEEIRISSLPSDICQVPEYREVEDRIREKIEAAKAALEPINEDLKKLDTLFTKAIRA